MIDRYRPFGTAMIRDNDGQWLSYADHVAEVCKYRDKILELAKQCEPCGGTGMITVEPGFTAAFGRVVPCNACEDLRELTS